MDILPTMAPGSFTLGIYLDAVLHHDEPLVLWIDVDWHSDWVVSAHVDYGTGSNIRSLAEFEDRVTAQPEAVPELLKSATDDLISAVGRIDFASLPPLPPEWPRPTSSD
jgi:hypothetical protein